MAHASHDAAEKAPGISVFYTICGVILAAVIGGPFLYAMMYLLNQ